MSFVEESPQESVVTPLIQSTSTPVTEFEVDKLPSKSLPYPKDCKIFVKPYTWGEISAISSSSGLSEEEKYRIVLSGIITRSLDKNNLTFSDTLYLGFFRKMFSSPEPQSFLIPFYCGECAEENKGSFKYIDLEFKDLEVPALPLIIEVSGQTLHFSPLTITNYIKMVKTKAYQDDITRNACVLAHQCINLPIKDSLDFISNITNFDDIEVLREINSMLFHEIKPVICKCKQCQTDNHISLDRMEAVLMPFRESDYSPKSRIRFGNQSCD